MQCLMWLKQNTKYLFTLWCSRFWNAPLRFFGGGGSDGSTVLGKMVGTAVGSSFRFLWGLYPSSLFKETVRSKLSELKYAEQTNVDGPGPCHLSLVRFTCAIHSFFRASSRGNRNKLTSLLGVLEQPPTQHLFTILAMQEKRRISRNLQRKFTDDTLKTLVKAV